MFRKFYVKPTADYSKGLIVWIDTHAHLDKIKSDTSDVIQRAKEASVHRIITIGTQREDWDNVVSISGKWPEVYGTLGMHPHTAESFNQDCESFLKENLKRERIVAVGEIGLDYYYEHSEKEKQKKVFDLQLGLAEEFGLPVEIHTRDAEEDTINILSSYKGKVRGLLHCFTGSYDLAKKALDIGFNISFSGILTFKNSKNLRDVCKKIPLNRMHIETDSPFLAPQPHRGKENQPSWVTCVADAVSEIHNVEQKTLSAHLIQNTLDVFKRIKKEDLCLN